MRVVLSDLSSFSGRIELPAKGQRTPYLDVTQAVRLHGELLRRAEHVELNGAGAALLELKSALLVFGTVAVQAAKRLAMRNVTAAFKSEGAVALGIQAELGECAELRLEVGDATVTGAVTLQGLAVAQEDSAGSFVAASLRINELSVAWGDIALRAPQLVVDDFRVGWGAPAFELGAARVRVDSADLVCEGVSARVSSFECEGLLVRDGAIAVAALRASSVESDVTRPADPGEAGQQRSERAAQKSPSRVPFADLRLLDGLMGRLHADVHVDATLAIVRRRALHKLRAQVQEGYIDFRALERGLSALEDSLLDFSVREDQLVLELGVPLLPTRGHGRPLVTWPLAPADEQRAQQGLARLSVLTQPNVPAKTRPSEQEAGSATVRLHALDVMDIDVELALTPARRFESALLTAFGFERLSIKGRLHHHVEDQDDAGQLTLESGSLELALADVPVGAKSLSIGVVQIGSVSEAVVQTRGVLPVQATVRAQSVALEELRLSS